MSYLLDPLHTDPIRIRKEREKARKLKQTQWWLTLRNKGECYYCKDQFPPHEITMDHQIPIARGGTSTKGNLVPCCRSCNQKKKLEIPIDPVLRQL